MTNHKKERVVIKEAKEIKKNKRTRYTLPGNVFSSNTVIISSSRSGTSRKGGVEEKESDNRICHFRILKRFNKEKEYIFFNLFIFNYQYRNK